MKIGLQELKWEGMAGFMSLRKDKWWVVLNTVMSLHIPGNTGNFFTRSGTSSFARRTLLHRVSH